MIDYKQRYLQKLHNDVNEKLYDLLVQHLKDVHIILPKHSSNKSYLKELNSLLYTCLDTLKKESNKYNYLHHYRYSLLIINTLLSYKPDEQQLKTYKMKILDEFSSQHQNEHLESISLAYQMRELRITYDISYLLHITLKQFIPKKQWDKAMYCLIAIELIEPDLPYIDEYKQQVLAHLKTIDHTCKTHDHLENHVVLLDTNVALTQLLQDIDNYSFPHYSQQRYLHLVKNLEKKNTIVITNSVQEELEKNLEFSISTIKSSKSKKYNQKKLVSTLQQRHKAFLSKYKKTLSFQDYDLRPIESFYRNYLGNLYEITIDKIEHQKLSKKLKKLSDRNGLLPEIGDMKLLYEAILLKQEYDCVAILSNDKDLYQFNRVIEKKFGITVLR